MPYPMPYPALPCPSPYPILPYPTHLSTQAAKLSTQAAKLSPQAVQLSCICSSTDLLRRLHLMSTLLLTLRLVVDELSF